MATSDFSMRRARAVEARGTGFEMRTGIKARPGSQGTLFQGGKPTAQHRWARGYSPTRMAAVGGALTLGGGGIHITAEPEAGVDPEYPGLNHPHFNPHSEDHTRRLILEPLARSTYDAADIGRLAGGIHLRVTSGTTPGEAAHYRPGAATINVNRQVYPNASPREGLARADAVLTHEVGHHVDISHNWAHYTDALNSTYGGDMESGLRGRFEHNADANMIEHFRNDPRNQRKTGFDVRQQTYGARGVGHMAGIGYTDPGVKPRGDDDFAASRREIWQEHYAEKGTPATPSLLHPDQFDVQQRLF